MLPPSIGGGISANTAVAAATRTASGGALPSHSRTQLRARGRKTGRCAPDGCAQNHATEHELETDDENRESKQGCHARRGRHFLLPVDVLEGLVEAQPHALAPHACGRTVILMNPRSRVTEIPLQFH
jgi:hypothetical protein